MSIFTQTTNGETAYKGTGSQFVDLFFEIGAARNAVEAIVQKFDEACLVDAETAAAILLWTRDIRHNGAGERKVFRTLLRELAVSDVVLATKVVKLIPKIGRYDDLRAAIGTDVESVALDVWAESLRAGNAISFKWVNIKKDKKLRSHMGFDTEKEFRKFIVAGRKDTIVEEKMCSKKWTLIDYGKLPSVASARYGKAFRKNDEDRYLAFINDKDTTINASVVFPHDVYRTYKYGNEKATASKQWDNLPELGVSGNILVMPDVSGSMTCPASGQITCMDVSVSLGVHLAQQCKGAFNGKMLTFSESPTLVQLPKTKDIGKLFDFTERMDWGMNTNIQAAWKAVLRDARKNNVKQEEMPSHILIMSDMQFDYGTRDGYGGGSTDKSLFGNSAAEKKFQTSYDKMKADFEDAGYQIPKIVYWNLNGGYGSKPAMAHAEGIALVSGFSPNILKAVVAAEEFTPANIMEDAIKPFREMLATV